MKRDIFKPTDCDALPRRFQDYIRLLENKVAALEDARPKLAKSRVKVVNYLDSAAEYYLPNDVRIQFTVGKDRLTVQARDHSGVPADALQISSEVGRLAVLPNVSNDISVKGVDR